MRRLAKLGSASRTSPKPEGSPSSPNPGASGASTPTEEKGNDPLGEPRKINITPSSTPKPANTSNQLGASSSESAQKWAAKSDTTPAPVTKRPTVVQEESIEAFSDRTLTQIFRLAVDPERLTDIHGHKLTFLPGSSSELAESGSPLKLTSGVLDGALLEALSSLPPQKPILSFLLPCFKRILRLYNTVKETAKEKREVLDEAKRLCISNSLFALTIPDLFGYVSGD